MPKYRRRPRRLPVAESAAATLDRAAEAVSDKPWNGDASRFTIQQWRRSCLVDTGVGDEDSKERYKLPVREPGGALSRGGVHAAAGGHGIGAVKGISDEVRRRVARKLVSLYRNQLDEDPPESLLALAGMSEEAAVNSRRGDRVEVGETAVVEAPRNERPGRLLVQLIKAGWSRNDRYYPAEVLERDGAKAFPAGTLNFVDHDTETEQAERPAGTVTRLASVQTGDAYWDVKRRALMAEVRLFAPWREAITDMAEAIGMSIRAWVHGEPGVVDGREGLIVSEIAEGRSVDYVTVPAAGGAIVSVLESVGPRALAEARNVGAWLESRLHLALTQLGDDMYGQGRLTRPERITLSQAIGDALQAWTTRVEADAPQLFQRDLYDDPDDGDMPHMTDEARQVTEAPTEQVRMALHNAVRATYGGEETYAWVRDFDPARAVVWFEVSDRSTCRLWQQAYSLIANGGQATLSGERVEVAARTVYEPISDTDTAEAGITPTPTAAQAVTEDVTDGDPPTAAPEPSPAQDPTTDVPVEPGAPDPTGTDPAGPASTEETEMPETPGVEPPASPGTARPLYEAQLADMRRENAALRARESARSILATIFADRWIPPAAVTRLTESLMARLPIRDGQLDEAELTRSAQRELTAAEQEHAESLQAAGLGIPRDLGQSGGSYDSSRPGMAAAELDRRLEEAFLGLGNNEKVAKVAAKGRD